MLEDVKKLRTGMTWRGCLAAAVAGAALLGAASGAQAGDGGGHWKKGRHYYAPYYVAGPPVRYYAPPVRYYAPPVIYAAPPPMVVYPQPMAFVPAYPYPAYAAPGGLSLGLTLPLR